MSSSGGLGGKYGFSKGRSARGSLGLEAFKFSCYLFIPISMVAFMIGIPENIRKAIDAVRVFFFHIPAAHPAELALTLASSLPSLSTSH